MHSFVAQSACRCAQSSSATVSAARTATRTATSLYTFSAPRTIATRAAAVGNLKKWVPQSHKLRSGGWSGRALLSTKEDTAPEAQATVAAAVASAETTAEGETTTLPSADAAADADVADPVVLKGTAYGGVFYDEVISYEESLEAKRKTVGSLLAPWLESSSCTIEVFESPAYNYRNRCDFTVWHNNKPVEWKKPKVNHSRNADGKRKRAAQAAVARALAGEEADSCPAEEEEEEEEENAQDDNRTPVVTTDGDSNSSSSSSSGGDGEKGDVEAGFLGSDAEYDGKMYFAMSPAKDSGVDPRHKLLLEQFKPATVEINQMMRIVLDTLREGSSREPLPYRGAPPHADARSQATSASTFAQGIFQVQFKSTSIGQGMVSLGYKRPISDVNAWIRDATALRDKIEAALGARAVVIGRTKGVLLTTDEDGRFAIDELLVVDDREFLLSHPDNCFTQPNQTMNHSMVNWVHDNVLSESEPREDYDNRRSTQHCLELYCGNGNFSTALSLRFRRLLVTETSRGSVEAAKLNIELNNMYNTTIIRISADDLIDALQPGARKYKRLDAFAGDFRDMGTVFVDPPRAGLGAKVATFVGDHFDNIVYMSCNPETLVADLHRMGGPDRFEVTAAALFDQFPFTPHVESCVVLRKKVQEYIPEGF